MNWKERFEHAFNVSLPQDETDGKIVFNEGSTLLKILDPEWVNGTGDERNSIKFVRDHGRGHYEVIHVTDLVAAASAVVTHPNADISDLQTRIHASDFVFFKSDRIGVRLVREGVVFQSIEGPAQQRTEHHLPYVPDVPQAPTEYRNFTLMLLASGLIYGINQPVDKEYYPHDNAGDVLSISISGDEPGQPTSRAGGNLGYGAIFFFSRQTEELVYVYTGHVP